MLKHAAEKYMRKLVPVIVKQSQYMHLYAIDY